jgi:uncharacterized membrane protein
MSFLALLADVPESHFQAAWYYSIILFAMAVLMALGGGWGIRGAVRVWRTGDRAAGGIIAAATVTALLIFAGTLLAGAIGLINTSGQG